MTEATTRPAAGGSYIREKDGSIRPAESVAAMPQTEDADAANAVPETTSGAQPKKRK